MHRIERSLFLIAKILTAIATIVKAITYQKQLKRRHEKKDEEEENKY